MLTQALLSTLAAYSAIAGMAVDFMVAHAVAAHACFSQRGEWVRELGARAGSPEEGSGGDDVAQQGPTRSKPLLELIEPPLVTWR